MTFLDKFDAGLYDPWLLLLLWAVFIGFLWAGIIKVVLWWQRRVDRQDLMTRWRGGDAT